MRTFFSAAPGAIWMAIIVGFVLLAEWLTTYFGGESWVPAVAGFLALVLVPILKILAPPPEILANRNVDGAPEPPSKFRRWLL